MLIRQIIDYAIFVNASDIHFELLKMPSKYAYAKTVFLPSVVSSKSHTTTT